MTEYEHQPFIVVSNINKPYAYFRSDYNFLFPRINIPEKYPEIPLLVNTIESYYENLMLYLAIDVTSAMNRETTLEKSSELILATQKSQKTGEEALNYVVTPLGTFFFDFFEQREDGSLAEKFTVFLTDEMKDGLFLAPCEVEYPGDGTVEIFHEYLPGVPFPPLRPEKYIEGSPQYLNALKYYEIQELKYGSATSVYCSSEDDEPDIIDEVLAEGGYDYGDYDEEDDYDDEDGYDEDDDYDEEDIREFIDGIPEYDDFFSSDCLDTIYYLIRPED